MSVGVVSDKDKCGCAETAECMNGNRSGTVVGLAMCDGDVVSVCLDLKQQVLSVSAKWKGVRQGLELHAVKRQCCGEG